MRCSTLLAWCAAVLFALPTHAQLDRSNDAFPALREGLNYRNIGPFRGGRSAAVTGVAGQPMLLRLGIRQAVFCNLPLNGTRDYYETMSVLFYLLYLRGLDSNTTYDIELLELLELLDIGPWGVLLCEYNPLPSLELCRIQKPN